MAAQETVTDGLRQKVVKWSLTEADPTGDALKLGHDYRGKSIHLLGTFGGGTFNWKGSNQASSPTDFQSLKTATEAGIIELDGAETMWGQPSLTGSSGGSVEALVLLEKVS